MSPDEPVVVNSQGAPTSVPEQRVKVRRRRALGRNPRQTWTVRTSRRRAVQTFVVCAAVMLLAALGVYFGLSRQDDAFSGSRKPALARKG